MLKTITNCPFVYRPAGAVACEKLMKPYLLLDVRDSDDYHKSHIITAESYPKANLSRANFETPSLLKYVSIFIRILSITKVFKCIVSLPQRNHPEYVIVLYDEDEILAPQVTTTLIQRGYNNVHMLSGGLKVAKHCFPHSLVVSSQDGSNNALTTEHSQILATQLQQMSFRYKKWSCCYRPFHICPFYCDFPC